MPDVIRWIEEQGLHAWLESLPAQLDPPMFAGRIRDGEISVEEVSDTFCRLFEISTGELPVVLEELFQEKGYPVDLEPIRASIAEDGWTRKTWEPLPGEKEVSCLCRSDRSGRFLAIFEDRSDSAVTNRLFGVRDSVLQMMELYESRDLVRHILKETVMQLDVDWCGVFLWDEGQQRWMLSVDEAKGIGVTGHLRSLLAFALQLAETPDGPVPYAFGGLDVSHGKRWSIPWKESAGRWANIMEEAGVGSLAAGVLLTGRNPAVLVSLSRRSGGFARINGEVLKTFWPILVSLFERNKAVEGITSLYPKDPVTGLYASGMLRRIVSTEMERAQRYGYPLACMILRIANMRELTEKGGLEMKNETLRTVARQVLGSIRNVDIAGRLDDSVLLLMPHTPGEGAKIVSERLAGCLRGLSPVPSMPLEVEPETAVFDERGFNPRDFAERIGQCRRGPD